MFNSILIAFVLASFTFGFTGCGTDDSPYATLESADCSGGAICLATDVAESDGQAVCEEHTMGLVAKNGLVYSAEVSGYPVFERDLLILPKSEQELFGGFVSASCGKVELLHVVFEVLVESSTAVQYSTGFSYEGKIGGMVAGFVDDSGKIDDGNVGQKKWNTAGFILSSSKERFSVVCLDCRKSFEMAHAQVTVCMRGEMSWVVDGNELILDNTDDHGGSCQTTQF